MKKNGTKLMMALGLFCLCHVNAADEMDSVGNLHDIFECYSASNWYGKSKKSYSGLVKQWPLSFPAMLRPVYHERAKSSGGTRDVFLLSDAGNTNQLVRLEIVCADSIKLAHRAMLEYFSSCSAVQPFPIASDDTGSVGDYCYFGYGKPWTSVMFVRDNVFVALKSLASMSSVRQEAEAIDKEIMRLASGNYVNNLEVSYLGAATNMLYITERGSLEDSVTHKNITLKIRYKDDSLAKHRKAIAAALMTAGTVTKLRESNAQIPVVADDNIAEEVSVLSPGPHSAIQRNGVAEVRRVH